MAISVTLNGVTYSIPTTGNTGWGAALTSYLAGIPGAITALIAAASATAAAAVAAVTAATLSAEFGTFGQRSAGGRIWGIYAKTTGDSGAVSVVCMDTPDILGVVNVPSYDSTQRHWNSYTTGNVSGDPAGLRQPSAHQFYWGSGPRLQAIIRTAEVAASEGTILAQRIWVALTDTNLDGVASSNAARYCGLRYDTGAGDTTWKLCSSDGVAASVVDTGVTVVAGTEYFLEVNFENTASLVGKVNAVSTTKATNLPVATGTLQGKWQATLTTLEGVIHLFRIHHVMLARK